MYSAPAFSQSGPTEFSLSGGLYYPNGTPITQKSVDFKIEILDASNTCVLYQEIHNDEDLSTTRGGFALQVGAGTSGVNNVAGGSALTSSVFENNGVTSVTGCGSVNLSSGDNRLIRVSYDLGSGLVPMNPTIPMTSSAYAMVAESVQGKRAADLVQIRNDNSTYYLGQSNIEWIFNSTNWPRMQDLLNGTSSQYMVSSPSADVSFNNRKITNLAAPTANTDAATKQYADGTIGGFGASLTGIGLGTGEGSTLVWDAVDNRWEIGLPMATDNTKLPLTGGTMSGAITMGGNDIASVGQIFNVEQIYNVGHITMRNQSLLRLGSYTSAQEGLLALGTGNAGTMFYNSDLNQLRVWNGTDYSGIAPGGAAGGDLTGSYPSPTIVGGAVTSAKIADGAVTSDDIADGTIASADIGNNQITSVKLNNAGIAVNRLLMTDATTGNTVAYATCAQDEILKFNSSTGWGCSTAVSLLGNTGVTAGSYGSATSVATFSVDAQGRLNAASNVAINFPVTSVAGKTGDVSLNTADIAGLGTAATYNVGTSAGEIPALDSAARIPAVDGGLLTNVNAQRLQGRTLSSASPNDGQVLQWNNTFAQWEPQAIPSAPVSSVNGKTGAVTIELADIAGAGDITEVNTGNGLLGGVISGAANLSVNAGTGANQIVQLGSDGLLPVIDGSKLTNLNALRIQGQAVSASAPAPDQLLVWNGSQWEPQTSPVANAFIQGGNSYSSVATLGTNDNYRLDFETNNSTRMSIDTSGNVGVGTTNPAAKLSVVGGNFYMNSGTISSTSGSDAADIKISGGDWKFQSNNYNIRLNANFSHDIILAGHADAEGLRVKPDGSVGIGTTNPSTKLDVAGSVKFSTSLYGNDNGAPYLKGTAINGTSNNSIPYSFNGATATGFSSTGANTGVRVVVNATETARFEGNNVGIGTTAPSARLDVTDTSTTTSAVIVPRAPTFTGTAVNGMIRYNTTTQKFEAFEGSWKDMISSAASGADITDVIAGDGLLGGASSGAATLSVQFPMASTSNGTAAAPAYSFSGDADNGMFKPSTNSLAFSTAGTQRLTIDSSGNVGIGTTAPSNLLTINGGVTQFDFIDDSTSLALPTNTGGSGAMLLSRGVSKWGLYVNNSGSFSIGYPGAASAVTVTGTFGSISNSAANISGYSSAPSQVTYGFTSNVGTGMYSPSTGQIGFVLSGTEKIRIDTNGNVGIGTSNPQDVLQVSGNVTPVGHLGTAGNLGVQGRYWNYVYANKVQFYNNGINSLNVGATGNGEFSVGGSRFFIDPTSGSVGIGTTSPTVGTILDLNGTGTAFSSMIIPRDTTALRPTAGVNGMIRYNTTTQKFEAFEGSWKDMISSAASGADITDVIAGSGLLGGASSGAATLSVQFPMASTSDGTAAAPAYSFSDDTDNGMFKPSTNSLAFSTAGTQHLTIDGSGNVGVGTTAPRFRMTVVQPGVTAQASTAITTQDAMNSTLSLQGAGQAYFMGRDVTNNIEFAFGTSIVGAAFLGSTTAHDLQLRTSNSTKLTIQNSSGNVGVGTTSPTATLDVNGTLRAGSGYGVLTSGALGVGIGRTMLSGDMIAGWGVSPQGSPRSWGGGINIPASSANLVLTNSYGYDIAGGSSYNIISIAGLNFLVNGSTTSMALQKNGSVGIGTTSPTAGTILDINGTGTAFSSVIIPRDTTALRPTVGVNGMIRYNTTTQKFEAFEGSWKDMISSAASGADITDVIAGSGLLGGASSGAATLSVQFPMAATSDGTAALPAYSFSTDPDTGMYRSGTNELAFSVQGTQRLRFDASGKANFFADVSTENGVLYAQDLVLTTAGDFQQQDPNATSYFAGRLTVGADTVTTGARLDVVGTGAAFSSIIIPRDTAANRPTVGVNGMIRYNTTTQKFEAFEGSWKDMISTASSGADITDVIAGSGLLGGATSGAATLSVQFPMAATSDGTAAAPAYSFSGDADNGMFKPSTNSLAFSTAGTQRLTIDGSGNVGIGTTSPQMRFHINGGARIMDDLDLWAASDGLSIIRSDPYKSGQTLKLESEGTNSSIDLSSSIYQNFTVTSNLENGRFRFNIDGNKIDIAKYGITFGKVSTTNRVSLTGAGGEWSNDFGKDLHFYTGGAQGSNTAIDLSGGNMVFGLGRGHGFGTIPSFVFRTRIGTARGTDHTEVNTLTLKENLATFAGGARVGADAACSSAKAGMLVWNSNKLQVCTEAGTFTDIASSAGSFSQWLNGASGALYYNSGNVGIGTATASNFKLQVAGNIGPDSDNAFGLGTASARWTDIRSVAVTADTFRGKSGNSAFFCVDNACTAGVFPSGTANGLKIDSTNGRMDFMNSGLSRGYVTSGQIYLNPDLFTVATAANGNIVLTPGGTGATVITSGRVGIGTASPTNGTILDLNGTGAAFSSVIVPRDTTALRPTTGVNGMIRYNTTTQKFEAFEGSWKDMISTAAAGADITDVVAGTGLLGGASSGAATLSVQFPMASTSNGTAAAPAYSFSGDTDNGMFKPITNSLAFSTAGVQRLTIDGSGSVGVGTASPVNVLHIANGAGEEGTPGIFIQDPTATSNFGGSVYYDDRGGINSLKVSVTDNGNETGFIALDRITGNVGIGTTAPTASGLHVARSGQAMLDLQNTVTGGTPTAGANWRVWADNVGGGGGNLTFGFFDKNNSRIAMGFDNSGNVGIGTTTPFAEMHVQGPGGPTLTTAGLPNYLDLLVSSAEAGVQIFGNDQGAHASTLVMSAGDTKHWVLSHRGPNLSNRFSIGYQTSVANMGSVSEMLSISSSGNVGIGTTTPSDRLHVAGDIRVGTGTTGCVKDADGTVIAGTCSSDERFKTEIEPLGNNLEQVAKLRPVTYKWRSEEFPDKHFGHETETGLIAQEVQKAIPELVAEDEEGYLKVRFTELNIYILQAVKELYQRVLGIENRQETQERHLASKADKALVDARIQQLEGENADKSRKILKLEEENAAMKAYLCGKDPNAPICK